MTEWIDTGIKVCDVDKEKLARYEASIDLDRLKKIVDQMVFLPRRKEYLSALNMAIGSLRNSAISLTDGKGNTVGILCTDNLTKEAGVYDLKGKRFISFEDMHRILNNED